MASSKKLHLPIEMSVNSRGLRTGLNNAQMQMNQFADKTSQKVQSAFGLQQVLGIGAIMNAGKLVKGVNTMRQYVSGYKSHKEEIQRVGAFRASASRAMMGTAKESRTRFIGPVQSRPLENMRKRRFKELKARQAASLKRSELRQSLGLPAGGNLTKVITGALLSPMTLAAIGTAALSVLGALGLKSMRDAQKSGARGDNINPEIIKALVDKDLKQFKIDRLNSLAMTRSKKALMDAQFRNKNSGTATTGAMMNYIDAMGNQSAAIGKGHGGFFMTGGLPGWIFGHNNGPFGVGKFFGGQS